MPRRKSNTGVYNLRLEPLRPERTLYFKEKALELIGRVTAQTVRRFLYGHHVVWLPNMKQMKKKGR
jgi:hypothetical protein